MFILKEGVNFRNEFWEHATFGSYKHQAINKENKTEIMNSVTIQVLRSEEIATV